MASIEKLTFAQAVSILDKMADDMIGHKDELTALDQALGDGDLGRTVERGFRAIKEQLAAGGETDLGKLLFKLGKTFSDAAASSFGALLGTAFMKGGMALKGKTEIATPDVIAAMQTALDALMERGKAKVGDKTMLDAIHPAIEALRAAAPEVAADLAAALRAAANAAVEGAEKTKTMQSMIGRASWQGERSIGQMDPGARAVALLLDAAARHVGELNEAHG